MRKISFTRVNLILGLLFLFTFYNCSLVPCLSDSGLEYVTDNPKSDFIAGKYKLESKISKYGVLENTENTELIINEDFTFQINNLPIEGWSFGVFQEKENILINILGKWKIIEGENGFLNKKNSIFQVNYDVENSEENEKGYSSSWKIYQKNGKAVIFYSLGDPDSCEAIKFIKVSE